MGPWGCRREVTWANVLEFLLNQCHPNDILITSQIRFTNYNLLQGSPNAWNFHWVTAVAAYFVLLFICGNIWQGNRSSHCWQHTMETVLLFMKQTSPTILSMASNLLSHNRSQLSAQWLRHPVWKQLRDPNPIWSADRQQLSEDRQKPACVLRLCWLCSAASNNDD